MAEFNDDANKRIAKTVQQSERKHQNARTRRARWFRTQGGDERDIPFKAYSDTPAYAVMQGRTSIADTTPGKVYAYKCATYAVASNIYRESIYINRSTAVDAGDSGTCRTGEHWPTLCRGAVGMLSGDIGVPTGLTTDDAQWALQKLGSTTAGTDFKKSHPYMHRFYILGYGPDSVRPEIGESQTYDVYWVQKLGIGDILQPMQCYGKVRRHASILTLSTVYFTGYSDWNVYISDDKDVMCGVEKMTASVYDDPCLKFITPGVYMMSFRLSWSVTDCDSLFTSTNTGTTDSHYHTYDKVNDDSMNMRITAETKTHAGSVGSILFGGFSGNFRAKGTPYDGWDSTTRWGYTSVSDVLIGVEANTEIYIDVIAYDAGASGSISTTNTNAELTCQWMHH